MDGCISRQDAVSRFSDLLMVELKGKRLPTWDEVYNAMQDVPSAQSEQKWIPCSEITADGYPTENGIYYVTEQNYGFYLDADIKRTVAHTSRFKNGEFVDRFYDPNHSNITAWMTLPEPYKDGEQNDIR